MRQRTFGVVIGFSAAVLALSMLWASGVQAARRGDVTVTVTEDRGEVVGRVTGPATDLLGSFLRCQDISTPAGCTNAVNGECSKTGHGTIKQGSAGKWDEISQTCSGPCADGATVEFKCWKPGPAAPKPKAIIDEPDPTSFTPEGRQPGGTPCEKGAPVCK